MPENDDILISVHPRFVDRMVRGEKTIELRRRRLRLSPGTRAWIYSTLPRGAVEALGIVREVVQGTPQEIWNGHAKECGVSKAEFDAYFKGAPQAFAVVFKEIGQLPSALNLSSIRERVGVFHPPQFFKRIQGQSPILDLFSESMQAKLAAE